VKRSTHIHSFIRRTYFEGALYGIMAGCAESFALYYAVKRNFSIGQIALLTTLPVVLGSITQMCVPFFVTGKTKLSYALKTSFFVQILGLALLVYNTELDLPYAYYALLAALSLYWMGGLTANPLWLDWVSGHVPPSLMGRYLAKRNAFIAFITLGAYISTAYVLNYEGGIHSFVYVFAAALIARSLGLFSHWRIEKRKALFVQKVAKEVKPEGLPMKKAVYISVFGSFLFRSMVFVASPFFLPYMVNELKLSILEYSFLTALPFIGRFLFLSGWGRASTNMRLFLGLELACFGLAIAPISWILSSGNFTYIAISQILTGLLWGGYELSPVLIIQKYWPGSTLNMLGFHLALSNLGSVLGSLLGAQYLKTTESYHDLFGFSISLRLLAALLMLYAFLKIKETRFKSQAYTDFLVTTLSLRPTADFLGRLVFIRKRVDNRSQKTDEPEA
jgi:hypothetical protein